MKRIKYSGIGAVALALALALPAAAQTTTSSSTTGGADHLPNGSLEKYHDNFRASELVGANVYDDQGDSIGKVNDLLVDDSGKAKSAVLSVGGFLGIASKYVEVPFEKLKVMPSRASGSDAAAAGATPNASAGLGAPTGTAAPVTAPATTGTPANTSAPGTGAAMTAAPTTGAMAPAAAAGPSKTYFSLVMPGATKDTLTSMPDFKYEG